MPSDHAARDGGAQLRRPFERNDVPITQERGIPERLAIDCRSSAVLRAVLLIHRAIPGRARCGFARYLAPHIEDCEDHWTAEYWVAGKGCR